MVIGAKKGRQAEEIERQIGKDSRPQSKMWPLRRFNPGRNRSGEERKENVKK